MNFQCSDDLESGIVLYVVIDWYQTPAHLITSSRKKLESN